MLLYPLPPRHLKKNLPVGTAVGTLWWGVLVLGWLGAGEEAGAESRQAESCGAGGGNAPASRVKGCRVLCFHCWSESALLTQMSPELLAGEPCPLSNQFCSQRPAPSCCLPAGALAAPWESFQTSSVQDCGRRVLLLLYG